MQEPRTATIELHGFAHGGEAVGRLPDGKACFVPYAIPGERVRVEIVEERKRWARARLVDVLEASPDRVEAPCPYFGPDRCGGCSLQHIAGDRRAELLRGVVRDQLERLGGIAEPNVSPTVRAGDYGYRNQARFAVDAQGRLAFRRAGSHELIAVDRCLLLHDDAQAVRDRAGDAWAGAQEVTVRAALAGEGTALIVEPGAHGLPPLPADETDDVALLAASGRPTALRGSAVTVECVGGFEFRVSPTSFFQANTAGAEHLLALVRDAAAARPGDRALDLYAGVGLFARGLAADGAAVVAVESDASACEDAEANLAHLDPEATVRRESVEAAVRAMAGQWYDIVVLDPPRKGAGTALCRSLAEMEPRALVYVSCDPAALGRDARALAEAGYVLERATPVDQFAQTAHVETVAVFRPVG